MLTVLTPAEQQGLVDVATLRDALALDVSADAMLPALIAQASATVASFCGRGFLRETVRETFVHGWPDGRTDSLVLSRFPVVSIAAVSLDGTPLDLAAIDLDPASGIVYRRDANGQGRCWGRGRIAVDYVSGFGLDDMPADIQRACMLLVRDALAARDRDPMLRSEDLVGVGRFDYQVGTRLNQEVEAILTPHRAVRLI